MCLGLRPAAGQPGRELVQGAGQETKQAWGPSRCASTEETNPGWPWPRLAPYRHHLLYSPPCTPRAAEMRIEWKRMKLERPVHSPRARMGLSWPQRHVGIPVLAGTH